MHHISFYWLLCILYLCVLTDQASAQILPFRTYSGVDGMYSPHVGSLFQDSRGYLWIGSAESISRFDGVRFQSYTPLHGFPTYPVHAIMEDPFSPGTIYAGTGRGGVVKISGDSVSTIRLGLTSHENNVTALTFDDKGRLLCGTTRGVFIITDDDILKHPLPYTYDSPVRFTKTPDGAIWIGNHHNIYILSGDGIAFKEITLSLIPDEHISGMYTDSDGSVWIGTSGGTVKQIWDYAILERYDFGERRVLSFAEDHLGSIWMGTTDGLYRMKKGIASSEQAIRHTTENGLLENYSAPLLFDRENNLWIGNRWSGLLQLSHFSLIRFSSKQIFPTYNNNSVAVSDDSRIWVTAADGIWELWEDDWGRWNEYFHHYEKLHEIQGRYLITIDPFGYLWIASPAGITSYEITVSANHRSRLHRVKQFHAGRDFPSGTPHAMYIDRTGHLWYSIQLVGIVMMNVYDEPVTNRILTLVNGLPGMSIRVIYEDDNENIWFGDFGEGLGMLPRENILNESYTCISYNSYVPDPFIRSFVQDADGNYWVGTRYGGIGIITADEVYTLGVSDGLLDSSVWCLTTDNRETVFAGMHTGIGGIDISGFLPHSPRVDLIGKPVYTCGVFDGTYLWFQSPDGLYIKNMDEYENVVAPPRINLENIHIDGKSVDTQNENKFRGRNKTVDIEFTGISLRDGNLLRYQYRMNGVDRQWHTLIGQRSVTYAAMRPGSYTFEVQAINSDNIPSIQPASFSFTIVPPFWSQWWFISSVILLVGAVVGLFIHIRVQRLFEIERLRSNIASDLHDDVGAALTRVSLFSDSAQEQLQQLMNHNGMENTDAKKVLALLEEIGTDSRDILESMRSIVWAVDPKNDSFENFALYMKSFASQIFETKQIDYSISIEPKLSTLNLPLDFRRNLFLIFKEAITNIIRHADAKSVNIEMKRRNKMFLLIIADDGKGFNGVANSNGHGLKNMKNRAKLLNGKLIIESTQSNGTRLSLIAKIP